MRIWNLLGQKYQHVLQYTESQPFPNNLAPQPPSQQKVLTDCPPPPSKTDDPSLADDRGSDGRWPQAQIPRSKLHALSLHGQFFCISDRNKIWENEGWGRRQAGSKFKAQSYDHCVSRALRRQRTWTHKYWRNKCGNKQDEGELAI